jgi:predicted amidohydrolase
MQPFVAAAVQMTSGPDRGRNLARAGELVAEAAEQKAKLVVLPELFPWRGPAAEAAEHHETVPGPTTELGAEWARRHAMYICMGSLREASPDPSRAYNTSCVLAPDGSLLARYRKVHLFDVDIAGRVSVRESDSLLAGDHAVSVTTPLATLGLSICYDLRFPELYRRLALSGAEVLLAPSAFTAHTGAAHWEVLCRARAIESQCYLVAANQSGTSSHGFADYGNSMIVDPWGRVLGRAADGDDVVTAELDADELRRVRAELPALRHVRLTDVD